MSTLITAGAETIEPTQVLGYSSAREGGTIVHPILGRENPDVTLRPAALRTGTLELLFDDEAASKEAEDLHALPSTFAVVSTDRDTIEMAYVVAGSIARELEDSTRSAWVVRVDFQEVTL